MNVIELNTWADVARGQGGFRGWMHYWGIDDQVTRRPVEQEALCALENEAWAGSKVTDLRLSPLEQDVLRLERQFLSDHAVQYASERYAWIAARIRHVGVWQIRGILDDISFAMRALEADDAAVVSVLRKAA